ncbi:Transcription factor Vhr1 [Nakaseomyces glabratus]|nr:hypothetical protein LTX96_0000074 [Nakaseomyces glabratus]
MAPNKHSKNGTTHKIREQLGFTDEKKWKRFSSRRLELIDKFQLSQFKASEQDLNIKQIANILRTEFGYPVTCSMEFEKLVTAAIQSVRRNRKRSKKKSYMLHGAKNMSYSTSEEEPESRATSRITSPVGTLSQSHSQPAASVSPLSNMSTGSAMTQGSLPVHMPVPVPVQVQAPMSMSMPMPMPMPMPMHVPVPISLQQQQQPPPQQQPQQQQNDPMRFVRSTTPLPDHKFQRLLSPLSSSRPPRPMSNPQRVLPPMAQSSSAPAAQKYDDIIKNIVADLVHNIVPLAEQANRDNNGLALKLSTFDPNNPVKSEHPPSIDQEPAHGGLPYFLREKLLLQIQKSKTCLEIATSQGSMELYANLETLGEMAIRTSIAFLVERFFSNMLSMSMEYISRKSSSDENLANLALKLMSPAVRINLANMPMHEVQIKTLYLLVGGIVKDFGFDPCLYPLSEAIHHLIMTQYPLVTNNSNNNNNNGQAMSDNSSESSHLVNPIPTSASQRATLLSTLPMKPESANQDINKKVYIKYRDNEHVFTFHQLSNGTPTIIEIMENCKSLFNIVNSDFSLGLFFNGSIINDDILSRLFNDLSNNEIHLEIRQTDQAVPKLSDTGITTGSIVPSIPIPTRPNSVKALDDIIGRMGKNGLPSQNEQMVPPPPPTIITPSNYSNNSSRERFPNNTLPQPVYQPLL